MKNKVCIYTLGCKVNQYESDAIRAKLEDRGFEVSSELSWADFYIINTCAVTNEAERKSRSSVAKCLSRNENAHVFVVGCASQKDNGQFLEKDGVYYVDGTQEKQKVIDLIEKKSGENSPYTLEFEEMGYAKNSKTRAFVKVQDGCDNFCSYCIVPYLRGRSRSRDVESIIAEIRKLENVNEIVLTGINLSDYNKPSLLELSKNVNTEKIRFRFGSLEVGVITSEFLKGLSELEYFCPQFHLSMQSGSTQVLKEMNRHYTSEEYLLATRRIYDIFEFAGITTDVIVGFPKESEDNFLETIETAKKAEFLDMHIFPYSKRTGTVASKYPDLDKKTKLDRAKRLAIVRETLREGYIARCKLKNFELLIEEEVGEYFVGHTRNFLKVYVQGDFSVNSLVMVCIEGKYLDGAKGTVIL